MGRTTLPLHAAAAALAAALLAGGCASPATAPKEPPALWQDAAFGYAPSLVTVDGAALFRLPPELAASLARQAARAPAPKEKLDILLHTVFGAAGLEGFRYRAGHSTVAAETWRESRGDCLSLTVLGYAAARALGLPAQMQEVDGPWLFDRHGQMDFINLHVNLLLPGALQRPFDTRPGDAAVDFDPDVASHRRGEPLDEAAMLARYYNNVAVQAFAAGERARAYAHFRAAARVAPGYAAPYANLAVMYRSEGRDTAAEASLRHALALEPGSWVALQALHELLLAQGRGAEAQQLARAIEERQARDPNYWIGRGREALLQGQPQAAVHALERARAISSGYEELHRYLAVAYARTGEPAKAGAEMRALEQMGVEQQQLGLLQRKIESFSR